MAAQLVTAQPHASADSFEDFFRANFGRVFGLMYRVTGNAQDAEDLSQELFLQLARRPDALSTGRLLKAATHAALNELRGERRRRAREERAARQGSPLRLVAESEADPAGSVLRREQQEAVRAALRKLEPRDIGLLLARHSGLSYAEVASALDLNPASVGTLLARAERRFREVYEAQENGHGE